MTAGVLRRRLRLALLVVLILLVVGAALLLVLRMRWREELRVATQRFEQEVGSLDPAGLAPPRVEPSDNAVSWLQAGGAALVPDPRGSETLSLARKPLTSWTAEEGAAARALVEGRPEVLSLLARAVSVERSSFGARYVPEPMPLDLRAAGAPRPVPDPVVDLIPHINSARFLRLATVVAILDGDCALAAKRIEVAERQARALLAERMVLFGLIGTATHRLLVDDVSDLLAECEDVASFERALAAIERLGREAQPADEVLRGEGVSSLAQMPWLLEEKGPLRLVWREHAYSLQASSIDYWREMVSASRSGPRALRDFSELQGRKADRPGNAVDTIAWMLTPDLADAAHKMILRDASGRVAQGALRLRIGGLRAGRYPGADALPARLREEIAPLGETIAVTELPDGAVEVGLPRALADWRESHPENIPEPRVVLRLPPLARARRSE